jgi:hypothetical protein
MSITQYLISDSDIRTGRRMEVNFTSRRSVTRQASRLTGFGPEIESWRTGYAVQIRLLGCQIILESSPSMYLMPLVQPASLIGVLSPNSSVYQLLPGRYIRDHRSFDLRKLTAAVLGGSDECHPHASLSPLIISN